jgi:hypothetical protein
MELSDGLRAILKDHVSWSKRRLDCFIGLLLALIQSRHMNLTQLAVNFGGQATLKSRYRRLQRFFQTVVFDYDAVAHLIMQLFDFKDQTYYLTLDRTNWKWGKANLNILTLAIAYKGIAVPVYWLVLNKQGSSNQRERIVLLQRFIKQFGRRGIQGVLADREFIGDAWWQWLTDNDIPYLIRMKDNQLLAKHPYGEKPVRSLFRDLKDDQQRVLRKRHRIGHQWVWLSALKLEAGELLVLAANRRIDQPIQCYAKRWQIENLFQCLKGRGFHLEDTRLTRYYRIKKVMALQALAFCWAHKVGEWKHQAVKPLIVKKHGRPECSLFRYGLDALTDFLLKTAKSANEILLFWILFWCPPDSVDCSQIKSGKIFLSS